jgi:aryl-alcohol dehydrogenase-like predicted oxidoreductase
MMFAQANSEHCRHKIFNASWTIDGEDQTHSLFKMIKATHAATPQFTLTAYADNAAVVEGHPGRRFRPDLIQAPGSLLDQRMLADGTLERIAGMGIEVQLRSIFLNGLLFLPIDRIPGQLKSATRGLSKVRRMIAEGRSDPLQAALGFALSRPEASTVLVNVHSAAELSAVIAAASSPPPDLDWNEMALDDEVVLDPRRWAAA